MARKICFHYFFRFSETKIDQTESLLIIRSLDRQTRFYITGEKMWYNHRVSYSLVFRRWITILDCNYPRHWDRILYVKKISTVRRLKILVQNRISKAYWRLRLCRGRPEHILTHKVGGTSTIRWRLNAIQWRMSKAIS